MRIAVVGGGVAGLTATWLLQQRHDVWLYEQSDRVGGHAHTALMTCEDRQIPVDTAFVIYNRDTYPTFSRLLDYLGVASRPAPTSFSCHIAERGVGYVYGRGRFRTAPSNWLRPSFRRMVLDTLRFYREIPTRLNGLGSRDGLTIGRYLEREGYGREFMENVLLPIASALWSLPLAACHNLEFGAFVEAFAEARFLSIGNRRHWRTVVGGSHEYVRRLVKPFEDRVRLRTAVRSVTRERAGVRVLDGSGAEDRFDQIIFASHADQTLTLLTDASVAERCVLGGFTYYANTVHLHHDRALMPTPRSHWATWNYFASTQHDPHRPVAHTYWMNKLQGIDDSLPTFVSLNPIVAPESGRSERFFRYEHPTLDSPAVKSQRELSHIQGQNRTWFCGSCFERGGSHEDAFRTGLQVARSFGVDLPWQ
ncbi:MAG: NAD/FAD-binding protein [Blastocatellia bacterium]|nr:MAG: NAD/FAD-binding protein [Blastocatellia bacterium]